MSGNQQGPRPSAGEAAAREWEAVGNAERREAMMREQVERDHLADAARGTRRRWWWPFTRGAER